MTAWLIDSLLSSWGYILFYWTGLYVFRKLLKDKFKWGARFFVTTTLLLFLAIGFNSANRPKFDRTPDQTIEQKVYESEIEQKALGDVVKAIPVQEQYESIVKDTQKKFEY